MGQAQPLKRRASAGTAYHMVHSRQSGNNNFQSATSSDALTEVDEIDDSYFDTRRPTSARRYVDTRGNQVIQQGNRRIVIHQEPPPKRKVHWLLILGIGMLLMLGLWVGFNWMQATAFPGRIRLMPLSIPVTLPIIPAIIFS